MDHQSFRRDHPETRERTEHAGSQAAPPGIPPAETEGERAQPLHSGSQISITHGSRLAVSIPRRSHQKHRHRPCGHSTLGRRREQVTAAVRAQYGGKGFHCHSTQPSFTHAHLVRSAIYLRSIEPIVTIQRLTLSPQEPPSAALRTVRTFSNERRHTRSVSPAQPLAYALPTAVHSTVTVDRSGRNERPLPMDRVRDRIAVSSPAVIVGFMGDTV